MIITIDEAVVGVLPVHQDEGGGGGAGLDDEEGKMKEGWCVWLKTGSILSVLT